MRHGLRNTFQHIQHTVKTHHLLLTAATARNKRRTRNRNPFLQLLTGMIVHPITEGTRGKFKS